MLFSKKRKEEAAAKEAEIQAIRQETFKSIENLDYSTEALIKTLENNWDITKAIWIAIGGNKRGR